MYQCLETIKLADGIFFNINLHQERINNAFAQLFGAKQVLDISKIISKSDYPKKGLYKARLLYGADNNAFELQFEPYTRRSIETLKLVAANIESKSYKIADRTAYNNAFALRGHCDDVLIEVNGFITDTSYCNIALFDGEKWYTPSKPLLFGVQRKALLLDNRIIEKDIFARDLSSYKSIRLFNAMISFGELEIETNKIEL
jgi:4-amino-4-deoxychorismate lyase